MTLQQTLRSVKGRLVLNEWEDNANVSKLKSAGSSPDSNTCIQEWKRKKREYYNVDNVDNAEGKKRKQ